MTRTREEVRRLVELAVPMVVTQLGSMMLIVVDTMMVGRVGVDALAGAALGGTWSMGTMVVAMGVLYGLDPIVTQAHGAGDGERLGLALQRGLVLAALASLPLALAWSLTGPALCLMGQEPRLAALAHDYMVVQIPGIFPFLAFTALRQYLQGRGLASPAMWVTLGGNLLNAAANSILIFGALGAPALGLVGAGVATTITRFGLLIGLVVWARRGGLFEGAWTPWRAGRVTLGSLREILTHGLPVGAQLALEMWAFQIATLLAGRIGAESLAAHTIVLNIASVTFMVPLGVSMAAVTRVGNLIGAGDPRGAQRAAWVALGIGAGVMGVAALAFVIFDRSLPALYGADPAVLAIAGGLLPIAAAFQLFDGTQVVGGGILRGMGRTRPAAVFNLVGYYALGLPLAIWLAFGQGLGVHGLWWGLTGALGAVAILLVVWVARRGPAHVSTQVPTGRRA
ncbi:MAG TPA: MATE family efflux transporter [Nannocystaceae bacterium]|nr:MATE family efflux transporter [Nannocystaceae bacterium]